MACLSALSNSILLLLTAIFMRRGQNRVRVEAKISGGREWGVKCRLNCLITSFSPAESEAVILGERDELPESPAIVIDSEGHLR